MSLTDCRFVTIVTSFNFKANSKFVMKLSNVENDSAQIRNDFIIKFFSAMESIVHL